MDSYVPTRAEILTFAQNRGERFLVCQNGQTHEIGAAHVARIDEDVMFAVFPVASMPLGLNVRIYREGSEYEIRQVFMLDADLYSFHLVRKEAWR